jgi:predicted nuclease of restriction endonuclease-like RecB superfamily
VLTKDLLRVSRAGGGYRPQFVDGDATDLAARVVGTYQGHVGEPRQRLDAALTDLEREAADFKLVRGFAKLLDRETTVETRAEIPPRRARRVAFEAAEDVGVVTEGDRSDALEVAADRLAVDPETVASSLYADLPDRQIVTAVGDRYDPATLVTQYNLSLAQTALFSATSVTIRSDDPKAVVSACCTRSVRRRRAASSR